MEEGCGSLEGMTVGDPPTGGIINRLKTLMMMMMTCGGDCEGVEKLVKLEIL